MDKLSDLPTQEDVEYTPEEQNVMQNMFGGADPQVQKKKGKEGWVYTFKVAGATALLFVVLANPWIDAMLCKMPWCEDGGLIVVGIKALLFLIIWVLMFRYLL